MQEYEIKKSRFYSVAITINSKEEIKDIYNKLWSEHKKATHICYGYSFIKNGVENAGYEDDGEPKGTAGKPIRDLLIITKTNNLVIFVIRYFGGIKLGGGGLIQAYRNSANIALKSYRNEDRNDSVNR
ncbi:YigZ family protein [Mycoplasmopsis californica]|uniref:YigZ family protein n=1 Tax=Mycoplasmopsis californica TaxID=2113 RepID=UPI0038CD2403